MLYAPASLSNPRVSRLVLVVALLLASILPAAARPGLQLVAPNGGERYQLDQRVTVVWSAGGIAALRIEYSQDNGRTWRVVEPAIDAAIGSLSFIPGYPTRFALVRITDVSDPANTDRSDSTFEVLEPPFIGIYSPTPAEIYRTGSTTIISWLTTAVDLVNIEYSSSGGDPGTWQRLASDVPARRGYFVWTVPTQTTDRAVIRILQVGGPLVAESGIFRIINPPVPQPYLKLIRPVGGEVYTLGDTVRILWSAANIATTISIVATTDGFSNTAVLTQNLVPASAGVFAWVPTATSGTYQIRIDAGGLFDTSRVFEVRRKLVPRITVVYPNGGERFMADSVTSVRWSAADISGDVTVAYSLDSGAVWFDIGTAPALTGTLPWTVPDRRTNLAMVKVYQAGLEDVSDGPFSIVERPTGSDIRVLSPNVSSVIWDEATNATITWQSVNVAGVDIALSTDGGASWGVTIAQNLPATPGSFTWRVPHLADTALSSLLLRISNAAGGTPFDYSDATYGYRPLPSGIGEDLVHSNALSFAPNPTSGPLQLAWEQRAPGPVTLRVYDLLGGLRLDEHLGLRESGANRAFVDLSTLPTGNYRFEVRMGARKVAGGIVGKL